MYAHPKVLQDFFDAGKEVIQDTMDSLETFTKDLGDQIAEAKCDMAMTIFDTAMKMFLRDNLVRDFVVRINITLARHNHPYMNGCMRINTQSTDTSTHT